MKIIFTVILIGFLSPVAAQQKEFSWLIGRWELQPKSLKVFEEWSAADDQKTLIGISYRINGADTVITEEIKIVFQDNSFLYIPDVAGEQGPVPFKFTQYDVKSFAAENPEHDFPKSIRYVFNRKESSDWLDATIEGNGKKISYTFVRVK